MSVSAPLLSTDSPTTLDDLLAVSDPSLIPAVPERFLERQSVVPIRLLDGRLLVATCDPHLQVPELADAFGASRIEYRVVTPTDFQRLRHALTLGAIAISSTETPQEETNLLAPERHLDPTYIALFDALLLEAIGRGASDIHLERYGNEVRFRLRVDGDLYDVDRPRLTPTQLGTVINVIKVKALLDIAEHRLPQGGRFTASAGDRRFDLRVQTQPALHGEHVVIRILAREQKVPSMEDLGFPHDLARRYTRLIGCPSGLLLIVGPTGSGKTTTVYAGLQILARDTTRKVITIEDPIEYAIAGIQQTQARPDLNLDFANAMRTFVREDPDVIFLGEIRDHESAVEAIRASQTGHIVISTMHCNDSVDAVQRLIDLGVHPNSIASELLGIFSQRLLKKICPNCRKEAASSRELLDEVFGTGAALPYPTFSGAGCSACADLGERQRTAVVEFLDADSRIRRAISREAPVDEIRAEALQRGWRPMVCHALDLVRDGVVALEQLPSAFSPEQLKINNLTAPGNRKRKEIRR